MSRSSEYWKRRFLDIEKASNAYGQEAFREIENAFELAENQIQQEIEKWYGRYAYNNQVTMQEARRQLSTKELKEFKWDVDTYIKYGRENALDQKWMKELENASARVHVNRLEALKLKTQHMAEVAFGNELDVMDAMTRKVFTEDYYHSIFEMQKGFNLGWEIGQIDERKLNTLITKPWAADGKNFSDRIWSQRTQLVNELHQQLTRSTLLGKAPREAIDVISKKFNTTKHQAGRLVMTEQAYFHSAAQKEAFKELDVEEFEIVATLDSRTSETCQEMDGQHFPMSQYEPGVTAPPFHVWCRSVTVPYFEDNFTGERAARDADGKTYYVPDSMKYKDWKEHFVDKTKDPADWLKPAIAEDMIAAVETMKQFTDSEVDEALEWYVSGEGQWVNQYLRNPEEWVENYGISDEELKLIEAIRQGTESEIVKESVLYRSVDASAVFGEMTDLDYENLQNAIVYKSKDKFATQAKAKFLDDIEGKEIIEKGFMSTTKDIDVALEWGGFTGGDKPIVIEFDVPRGIKGVDLSRFDVEGDEQFEVLLSPNQKYKIKGVTSKQGQIYVKADLVAEGIGDDFIPFDSPMKYNHNKMSSQFKLTEAMNEYDYFSKEQEQFRLNAIRELTGVDETSAKEYLNALCGDSNKYMNVTNSGGYYDAKSWFYGGDSQIRVATSGEFKEKAEIIHDYITKAPKYEGEIYRGLSLPEEQISLFKKGGTFEETGHLSSWTSSVDVADMFAQGRSEEMGTLPVIIKTKNPQYGTPISHLSIFGQEELEVLVSNFENRTYQIADVTKKNGVVFIELE